MSVRAVASTPSSRRRRPATRALAAVLIVMFAFGWWALLRPASLGGPLTMIVVNGVSMEPGLHTGDLALVYQRDSYEQGDVVAFRHQNEDGQLGSHVIHRIIGGDADRGFSLQGDNNDWVDPWEPTGDQIAGEMLLHVAGFGKAILWISQPVNMAALFASITIAMIVGGSTQKRKQPETGSGDGSVPAQREAVHDSPALPRAR
jgi:signal peptidase I